MTPDHPRWMNEYDALLLDKPSVDDGIHCAVCGRPATNLHHVIEKGMGGVSHQVDRRIPKIRLCGMGNVSGCHGLVHKKLLHIYWDSGSGDWVMLRTREPMKHSKAWECHCDEYSVLPGWYFQRKYGKPIGAGR